MSYERSYSFAQAFKGGNATPVCFSISLVPSGTTTSYSRSFADAESVELLSAKIETFVLQGALDKTGPISSGCISRVGHGFTTVHECAGIGGMSSIAGIGSSHELGGTVGLRRKLKSNTPDDGDVPSFFVVVGTSWNSTASDVAWAKISFSVRFNGESNTAAYATVLTLVE